MAAVYVLGVIAFIFAPRYILHYLTWRYTGKHRH